MKIHLMLGTFLLMIALQSCERGFSSITKSNTFSEQVKSKKIIYYTPEVHCYNIEESVVRDREKENTFKDELSMLIKSYSKRKHIPVTQLEIKNLTQSSDFPALIGLKNNVLSAINLQDNPLNKGTKRNNRDALTQSTFILPPRLNIEFLELGQKYQTNIFGLCGIYNMECAPSTQEAREYVRSHSHISRGTYFYYYEILVNIETSEVIYMDFKKVEKKLTKSILYPLVYDSFYLLKQNIKK